MGLLNEVIHVEWVGSAWPLVVADVTYSARLWCLFVSRLSTTVCPPWLHWPLSPESGGEDGEAGVHNII